MRAEARTDTLGFLCSVPVAGARPEADFGPLATRGSSSHFDSHRSRVVSRSMFTDEYQNPDGTRTFKQSPSEPLNVKGAVGTWQPVDTGLVTEPSGRVRVKRYPLNPSLGARAFISAAVDRLKAS
jgi:hypothetical protein